MVHIVHILSRGAGIIHGLFLENSSYNRVKNNTAYSNNLYGILLDKSSNNMLMGNNASNNSFGIVLGTSHNNTIYYNNFINNTNQSSDSGTNSWYSAYPSGGNYWSDYTGVDLKSGPSQNLPGSDGIGDTPYNISGGGGVQDRYPLMTPYSAEALLPRRLPQQLLPPHTLANYICRRSVISRYQAATASFSAAKLCWQ